MKYDFTSLMNRSGHDSIAVDRIPIPGCLLYTSDAADD